MGEVIKKKQYIVLVLIFLILTSFISVAAQNKNIESKKVGPGKSLAEILATLVNGAGFIIFDVALDNAFKTLFVIANFVTLGQADAFGRQIVASKLTPEFIISEIIKEKGDVGKGLVHSFGLRKVLEEELPEIKQRYLAKPSEIKDLDELKSIINTKLINHIKLELYLNADGILQNLENIGDSVSGIIGFENIIKLLQGTSIENVDIKTEDKTIYISPVSVDTKEWAAYLNINYRVKAEIKKEFEKNPRYNIFYSDKIIDWTISTIGEINDFISVNFMDSVLSIVSGDFINDMNLDIANQITMKIVNRQFWQDLENKVTTGFTDINDAAPLIWSIRSLKSFSQRNKNKFYLESAEQEEARTLFLDFVKNAIKSYGYRIIKPYVVRGLHPDRIEKMRAHIFKTIDERFPKTGTFKLLFPFDREIVKEVLFAVLAVQTEQAVEEKLPALLNYWLNTEVSIGYMKKYHNLKIKENKELHERYGNDLNAEWVYVPAQENYCYKIKELSGSPGGGVYYTYKYKCIDKFPQYISDLIEQFNMLMRYTAEINKRKSANATFSREIKYTQEKKDTIMESQSYPTPELVEEVSNLNIQLESLQYQQTENSRWLGAAIYHKKNVIEPRISKRVKKIREYIESHITEIVDVMSG